MKTKSKNQNAVYENLKAIREQNFQRGAKPIIGIDIGTTSVKMVQMKKNNKIEKWGVEPIPEGLVNQGRIESPEHLAKVIVQTKSKNRISGNECALCLSSNEVIVRELKMPKMAESQIAENVRQEITSYLPMDHDDYTIDYKILEYVQANDNKAKFLRVLATAAPDRLLKSYMETLKLSRLKLSFIDVVPNVAEKISRWVMMNNSNVEGNGICIIDFGAHTTNIVVIKDGSYFIHKSIINGSEYLTTILSDKMGISFDEAERLKKLKNLFEDNIDTITCQHVQNFVDYLIVDIERIMEFFKSRSNQHNIDYIYIMGGGSQLMGLPKYLQEHIGVKVERVTDALLQYKDNKDMEILSVLFNAIGSTMREE
jgi:type IV pilus assembly protein PilM